MKLTQNREKVLRALVEYELSQKNNGKWADDATAHLLAHRCKMAGWVFSPSSVRTYLVDLELMDLVKHDAGVRGTWRSTETGRVVLTVKAAA